MVIHLGKQAVQCARRQVLLHLLVPGMGIREVIAPINQMQSDGVIERYAIGGAVGATFYHEPVATPDVDILEAQFLSNPP